MKLDILFAGKAKDPGQVNAILEILSPLGIDGHQVCEADNDRKTLENALIAALRRSDVILIIGGLGSGFTDFTTDMICEGLGLREGVCPAALEQMKKRYQLGEETLSKEDLRKVKIPAGAHPLLNIWGDCPGYALVSGDQCIAALPDGAAELASMAEKVLLPYLNKIYSDESQPVEGGAFGISLEDARAKTEAAKELASVSIKKEGLGLFIRIMPEGDKSNTETACGMVQNALEGAFFPGSKSLAEAFLAAAAKTDTVVATAEREGKDDFRRFLGTAGGADKDLPKLSVGRKSAKDSGIPRKYVNKRKGATWQLAVHMARSAREHFSATVGIGVTGFRSGKGHCDEAYVAMCDHTGAWVAKILVPEERLDMDTQLEICAALDMARRYMDKDSAFLSRSQDLGQCLSGKITKDKIKICTFSQDGTAIWQSDGEQARKEKKAKRSANRRQKSSPGSIAGKVVLSILAALILLAAGAVGSFFWQAYRSQQLTASMLKLYQAGETASTPENYPEEFDTRFSLLWQQNKDVVGWLSVPDTEFSLPVVQGKDNSYYSLRNFKKEPNLYGTAYLNARSDLGGDENIALFGNRMEDGSMFAGLEDYRKLTFYRDHPVISFDSVYGGSNSYKVCAVFVTDPKEEDQPDFESWRNFEDQAEWENAIDNMKQRSLICAPVDIRKGDKFLTLSTSVSDFDGARLIVVARKTRSGEIKSVKTDDAVYNASPVLPQQLQQGLEEVVAPQSSSFTPLPQNGPERPGRVPEQESSLSLQESSQTQEEPLSPSQPQASSQPEPSQPPEMSQASSQPLSEDVPEEQPRMWAT